MRRTARIRIAALVLIALIGLPGLLRAGCPSCEATSQWSSACHQERGPAFHPACCGGSAALVDDCCIGPVGGPSARTEAAIAPQAPAGAAICPAPVPVVFLLPETPEPVRLVTVPPGHGGNGLYTLYSTLLI